MYSAWVYLRGVNTTDYENEVEQHQLLDPMLCITTIIYNRMIQFRIEAPEHVPEEQPAEHDPWPPYLPPVQNGHHSPSLEF